jgi:membrane protein
MVARIIRYIKFDIWNMQLEQISATKAFLLKFVRIVVLSVRGFDEDKCVLRASALTFYTMLSIVPVLAMAFGVAKGFGFEKLLERQILERLQGQEEIASYMISFSSSMLENTKGGMVAGIGIVLLFWAVIKLLGNIETSFNAIWGVKKGRSMSRKFCDYLSAMMLCPVLLIMAGGINVLISSQVRDIVEKLPLLELMGPAIFSFLNLLPYCVMWALFSFLYMFMPNTNVRFKAGIAGGIVAGILFQWLQVVYISFQIGVAQYNAVYGGFAALPLFLIWLNLSWLIVLLGAEITFAFQHADTYEFEPECRDLQPGYKRLMTLWVMHVLVTCFQQGDCPAGVDDISMKLRMPARLVQEILTELMLCSMVAEVNIPGKTGIRYQPARDISTITISSVIEALDGQGGASLRVSETEELRKLEQHLERFRALVSEAPENRVLASL